MFPVLLSGASGLVGTALTRRRPMVSLTRTEQGQQLPWWSPLTGELHDRGQHFDAVVHLAGAGVADRRWTEDWKAQVRDSRVLGTRTLVSWLASLPSERRPRRLVAASAVGFYGDRGEEFLAENSAPGTGFLAETCKEWEAEVCKAEELGVRTVRVRIGVVLSAEGGALEKMIPAFKMGAGGPLGSGRQWFPWVHIDDLVQLILLSLDAQSPPAVINAVAPGVCRQGDFARTLGAVLHRPSFMPAPAAALRLAMGRQMADEILLSSQRVAPSAAREAFDFTFAWPELEPALRAVLSR